MNCCASDCISLFFFYYIDLLYYVLVSVYFNVIVFLISPFFLTKSKLSFQAMDIK